MNEILVLSNPRGRKGHRKHHKKSHRHGYRRNPVLGLSTSGILGQLKDGAVGAAGGLVNDALYGYVKGMLPAALQDGYGRIGAKLGLAVLAGVGVNMVFKGRGRAAAVGAVTVTLHELGRTLVNQNLPAIPMGAYEDSAMLSQSPASLVQERSQTGAYMAQGAYMPQGAYMNGDMLPQ